MSKFIRISALARLFYGACAFTASTFAASAFAAAAAASTIAPGTYLIEGEAVPDRQPDGNSIILEAPQGLIVFDTGRHQEHIQQVIDFASAHHRPVAAIVNSHWHLDHVGGNVRLRAAFPGVRVYASSAIDAARRGFLADYRAHLLAQLAAADAGASLEPMRAEIALIDAGSALGPTDVIDSSVPDMRIAGRALEVHLESHAVTAGDVWVFDPATRVLLAGDLVTLPAPFFETACPERWRASLAHLERVRFDWLVPGHGAPMRKQQLTAYRRAFSRLLDCAAGNAAQSQCIDGWVADASTLIEAKDVGYAKDLIGYYVDHNLRHPTARIRAYCTDDQG